MKQKPPKRRKSQPKKRSAPPPKLASGPIVELGQLRPQVRNAVLDPIGTREGPLTLRADAAVGVQVEATVIRAAQHEKMLSWIGVFEGLTVELPEQQRPGIGHNLQPITEEDQVAIKEAIYILKHQPVAPKAPDEARAAASTLKKIGERLGTYLDTAIMEA